MNRQDIPNLISWLRVVLVFPVVWFLLSEQFAIALVLFAIAGFSDALDGFWAKHYHWESRLGSILDPLADKFLLLASFATLTWLGLLPAWLLWVVLARDIFIVLGALIYHHALGQFDFMPLWSSKINTVLQIALVLIVIVQQFIAVSGLEGMINMGVWLVLASVINSGTEYSVVWGLRAWKQIRSNNDG